jgi:hypothetical protein
VHSSGPYQYAPLQHPPPPQHQQQQYQQPPAAGSAGRHGAHSATWVGRGPWGSIHAARDSSQPPVPGVPPWQQRAAALGKKAGASKERARAASSTTPERQHKKGAGQGRSGTCATSTSRRDSANLELRDIEQEFLSGLTDGVQRTVSGLSGFTAYSSHHGSEYSLAQGRAVYPSILAAAMPGGMQAATGIPTISDEASQHNAGRRRTPRHSRSAGGAGRRHRKGAYSVEEVQEGPERLLAIIDAVRTSAGGAGPTSSREVASPISYAGTPVNRPLQSHVDLSSHRHQAVQQTLHPQYNHVLRSTSASELFPDVANPQYSQSQGEPYYRQPGGSQGGAHQQIVVSGSPAAASGTFRPGSPAGARSPGIDLAALAEQLVGLGITDPQLLQGFAEGFIDGRLEAYPDEFAQVGNTR